jgi:hypothetical protein
MSHLQFFVWLGRMVAAEAGLQHMAALTGHNKQIRKAKGTNDSC